MIKAMDSVEQDPFGCGAYPLSGRGQWAIRVGRRRIILDIDTETRRIAVVRIGPRGDIYEH
jgi:mRNA-degrading endonuclease RelE of RelBE toxin-antitoxin system